jgi:hypothetical protein
VEIHTTESILPNLNKWMPLRLKKIVGDVAVALEVTNQSLI